MPKIPRRMVSTASGCDRIRIDSPLTYEERCNQNTPKKKDLKLSNISMKKYHQSPTLGVKSVSVSWVPYVDVTNSHDPVKRYEMPRSVESEAATVRTTVPANCERDEILFVGCCRS